jgi:hypothetical protein
MISPISCLSGVIKMSSSRFSSALQQHYALTSQAHEEAPESNKVPRHASIRAEELVLPKTIKWARSIPSDLRPRALVIKFPRIANAMADIWSQPRLFNILLCQLMLDDRGERDGFPLDVLQDLANLRVHFDSRYKHPGTDVWCSATDRYRSMERRAK